MTWSIGDVAKERSVCLVGITKNNQRISVTVKHRTNPLLLLYYTLSTIFSFFIVPLPDACQRENMQ